MKHTLPGQLDLPAMPEASEAKRLAVLPLKPTKPQEACDQGLFSDDANQLDLLKPECKP
jgi:hypothetical protein